MAHPLFRAMAAAPNLIVINCQGGEGLEVTREFAWTLWHSPMRSMAQEIVGVVVGVLCKSEYAIANIETMFPPRPRPAMVYRKRSDGTFYHNRHVRAGVLVDCIFRGEQHGHKPLAWLATMIRNEVYTAPAGLLENAPLYSVHMVLQSLNPTR